MGSKTRPPIITILGHVDHGKTTLLDAIRKTDVASKEAGGITQSIGASQITTKDGIKITFIDTPGHAAFSKMRGRGVKVADIAVLVVSADDGVKPQTQESLAAIKEAQIPFIVAITKTDLASADPEAVKGQLEKEGVLFEGRGGDTPINLVSAKKEEGLKELLETISLVSEVHGLSTRANDEFSGVVIETSTDKRGPVASVVIRSGTLAVGEVIYSEGVESKIRGLFNYKGESIKEVSSGDPAQIIGFSKLPQVGSQITKTQSPPAGEIVKEKLGKISSDEIPILLKAKNAGGLEAVGALLPDKIVVVEREVGDVTESDVLNAKAYGAIIFAFESNIPTSVTKLGEAEGVKIERYDIIYELALRLEELLRKGKVEILGKAEILATFPFDNKKVAGAKVLEGKISKTDSFILKRDDKEIGRARAVSMKKQKQEISEAKAGEEFGVILDPQLDFKIGDMLVSVAK